MSSLDKVIDTHIKRRLEVSNRNCQISVRNLARCVARELNLFDDNGHLPYGLYHRVSQRLEHNKGIHDTDTILCNSQRGRKATFASRVYRFR